MKKHILLLFSAIILSAAFSFNSSAQSAKEELDYIQSIFGMEKKAVVADFLELDPSNEFWTVYDEYETERKELGKLRLEALAIYAEHFEDGSDDTYDGVIDMMQTLRKKNDKLMDKYYKKVKKVSGSKVAAQFFQIEAFFISEIRAAVLEQIPYFGEFGS